MSAEWHLPPYCSPATNPFRHFSWVSIWVSWTSVSISLLSSVSFNVLLFLRVIGFGLYKTLSFPYLPNLPSSFNSVHWSDTYQPTDPEGNACGRLVALEFSHLPIQSKKCHMFIMYRSLEGNSSFMEKAVQRQGLFIWSLLTEYWESSKIRHRYWQCLIGGLLLCWIQRFVKIENLRG